METYDFGGLGPVPAHRHINPDGTIGGWVSDDSFVSPDSYVCPTSIVYGRSVVLNRSRVTKGSVVGDRSVVANESFVVRASCVLRESTVTDYSVVRDGTVIMDSVVTWGAVSGASIIRGRSVVAKGSRVSGKSVLSDGTVLVNTVYVCDKRIGEANRSDKAPVRTGYAIAQRAGDITMGCNLCRDFECEGSRIAAQTFYPGCPVVTDSGRYGRINGGPKKGIHHWFVEIVLSVTDYPDGSIAKECLACLDANTVQVVPEDDLPEAVRKITINNCQPRW